MRRRHTPRGRRYPAGSREPDEETGLPMLLVFISYAPSTFLRGNSRGRGSSARLSAWSLGKWPSLPELPGNEGYPQPLSLIRSSDQTVMSPRRRRWAAREAAVDTVRLEDLP